MKGKLFFESGVLKKRVWVFGATVALMLLLAAGCGSTESSGVNVSAEETFVSGTEEVTVGKEVAGETATGEVLAENLQGGEDGFSEIGIGNVVYYDLLAGDSGELYALVDASGVEESDGGNLNSANMLVWKCTDQGWIWKETLYRPEELSESAALVTGALRMGNDGLEAFEVWNVESDSEGESADAEGNNADATQESRLYLYRVTETGYDELETEGLFEQLGSEPWDLTFVNDHVISLAGSGQCLLYDFEACEVVKTISYDSYSVGFLSMPEQFVVYGKEIVSCLDAQTLEEQDADDGLKEFVALMYGKNRNEVFPPMSVCDGAVVCVTANAVYEYQDGETTQTLLIPNTVNGGKAFNGMLPICKSENVYYACILTDGESLLRMTADK